MSLGKDILDLDDLAREPVEVARWGKTVYVREITADEYAQFGVEMKKREDDPSKISMMTWFVCRFTVNEDGERLWSDEQEEKLAKKNKEALLQIFEAILRLNGLSKETPEKNFETSLS